MEENPKLATSGALCLSCDEMDSQKISVSDQTNSLQFTNIKSDSFTVDMERFSHLTDKENPANSRITLQRSFSRKGSMKRGTEKKINDSSTTTGKDQDTNIVSTASPRAALGKAAGTPERPITGTTDPQVHHQITIVTSNLGGGATTSPDTRCTPRRFSFRRSNSPSWSLNPRRILFFFATLSSMGTLLLIYFTLSMGKLSGEENAMNW